MLDWVGSPMIRERTLKTDHGLDRMIDCSLKKRATRFLSYLVLKTVSHYAIILSHSDDNICAVWCWGWDGAGDLEGPDVDPVWEQMSNKSIRSDAVTVKHDRSLVL